MSVAVYGDDELCALWFDLGGDPALQHTLAILGWANRAAHGLSYGDSEFDVPVLAEPKKRPEGENNWRPDVQTWAENLLYNCVSNGGTDFAPKDAQRVLIRAAVRATAAKPKETSNG